ncbi:porin family protein [Vibrio cholerae]
MKYTNLLALTSVLATGSVLADIQGHRIGVGFNNTKIEDALYDEDYKVSGLKLEYGYEFNSIVGINLSYTKGKETFYEYFESDTSTLKIDADIGYTFQLDNSLAIKPYAAIGLVKLKEKFNAFDYPIDSWSDNALFVGLGTRATFAEHFYADLRLDYMNLDDDGDDIFVDQFSLTFGYKF